MAKTKVQTKKSKNHTLKRIINAVFHKWGEFYDYRLLLVIVTLMLFGVIIQFSASYYTDTSMGGINGLLKPALFSAMGVGVMVVVSKIPIRIIEILSTLIFGVSLILVMLLKTGFGVELNGAKRWLKFPIIPQFQPAEILKIGIIVFLPFFILWLRDKIKLFGVIKEYDELWGVKWLYKRFPKLRTGIRRRWARIRYFIIFVFISAMLGLFTLYFSQNLSTGIIVAGIAFGITFFAYPTELSRGHQIKWVAILVVGYIALYFFGLHMAKTALASNNFRHMRFLYWLYPEDTLTTGGMQVVTSLYAIGTGGLLGKGIGNGIEKYSISQANSDYIFAVLAEELGVVGVVIFAALFIYLLKRLMEISGNANSKYGSLMVSGIFIHIALQVILNVAVAISAIPPTGVTLPFFSNGGTSILILSFEMGLALMVSNQIGKKS